MNNYYIGIRILADRIGIDPWDIDRERIREYIKHEATPCSRFWFGSPCRFVRAIDLAVHVYFANAIEEKYPQLATYLRTTSPRWGSSWRIW